MDVDGPANRVVEVEWERDPRGPDNPHGTSFRTRRTVLASEGGAVRDVNPLAARRWRVESAERTNRMGHPTAYELVPGDNVAPAPHADSGFVQRAGFIEHHLWVTPQRDDERYPAGDYPNQHPAATACRAGRRRTARSTARTSCSGTCSAPTTRRGWRTGRSCPWRATASSCARSASSTAQRQESMLVAQRLADVAELLAQRTNEVAAEDPDPGYMMVTGFQRTTAEVAAACNLSPAAASVMVSHADTLPERLPKVAAVLAVGDTDWRTVQVIINRTEFVADSVMAGLDANLAERISQWHCWSRRRIINAVDATVRGMDPDAVRGRERQEDRRHFDVIAVGDGTAKVDGIIAADAAAAPNRACQVVCVSECFAQSYR